MRNCQIKSKLIQIIGLSCPNESGIVNVCIHNLYIHIRSILEFQERGQDSAQHKDKSLPLVV